ncbi:hypothetical protein ACQKWADRAFT_295516 [Trichoderma austrokoningii]
MASLLALPCELSSHIVNYLGFSDKVRLSATCKAYRIQLIPEIFTTIRFKSDEASSASALAAVEAHGQYTKTIEFKCQCEHEESPPPTGPSLPPAACSVLKGLLTPNLHTAKLEFDFNLDDDDLHVFYFFDYAEDAAEVRRRERQDKWRALMNETWAALVTNTAVRELILDELPPKWTSTFYTDEYHQFLNRLESATIHIFGMQNGQWRTNITNGCEDFLSSLDVAFFRHMKQLKYLYIWATDPLGRANEDTPYKELPLRPGDLPLLQSLTLENYFVSPELVLFIKDHAQILKSLRLNESFCGEKLSWAEFFDQVYEAKPSFIELIYRDNKAPFMIDDEVDMWMSDEPALVRIRQKMEADPTLEVFRQGYLDSDTGVLFFDPDEDVKRFIQGDDQRAYVRLMGLVNENRAEAKSGST